MKGIVLLGLVLALGAAAPGAASPARPALRVATTEPLEIRGFHFQASERVRLFLRVGETKAARVVRANARGAFSALFEDLAASRCDVLTVRAIGARGSEARLKLEQPACLTM